MHEVLVMPEGLSRLERELERLVTVERAAVTARLKDVVESDGDLAGNGDYLDAKEEQALVEQRIVLLTERLACARVIDAPTSTDGVVTLSGRVRLRELGTNETFRVPDCRVHRGRSLRIQDLERVARRKNRARTHEGRDDCG